MTFTHAQAYLSKIVHDGKMAKVLDYMRAHVPHVPSMRFRQRGDAQQIESFWASRDASIPAEVAPESFRTQAAAYAGHIEHLVGQATLPVGVVGPLHVRGTHAQGYYPIPLATTEAALVASYHRGTMAINRSGGVIVATTRAAVLRTPAFIFHNAMEAIHVAAWIQSPACMDVLHTIVQAHSRHGRLLSIDPHIDNELLFLCCSYHTGDASGQNMVTILTQHIGEYIATHAPHPPRRWFVEANASGDKKASQLANIHGRGRKVSAQVHLSHDTLKRVLGTTQEAILDYARVANVGAHLAGQQGIQGHLANGLAALYIATGQDPACVAEGATGTVRIEAHPDGVTVSATIPSIMVGTVGGGTSLPTPSKWLEFMGLRGAGKADTLAEVAAGLCLAGEISISAAIASGHFTQAHHKLARTR